MANISGGLQGMQQGAQLGSNFGAWGTAIGAGAGLLLGLGKTDPAEQARKAAEQYNKEVVKNTAASLFDRQRAQQVQRMRTASALQAYQQQGAVQTSQVRAGYGAADVIGGSATALAQAIDFQTNRALARTNFNYAVSLDNYNTNIDQITNQGVNSLKRTIDVPQQQGADLAGLFGTGKSIFDAAKGLMGTGGYNAGLQLGSTPSIPQAPSNYQLPSNLNLNFKGF